MYVWHLVITHLLLPNHCLASYIKKITIASTQWWDFRWDFIYVYCTCM